MNSQIIKHNDLLYLVKRTIRETSLKPDIQDFTLLKEVYHSDIVLKKDGIYYFAEQITEPEIIKDAWNTL